MNHVWDIRSSKYSVDLLFKDHLAELDKIESNAKVTVIKPPGEDDDDDPESKFMAETS